MTQVITSLSDFVKRMETIDIGHGNKLRYFRGVKSTKYKLQPTIFRDEPYCEPNETKILTELFSLQPEEFEKDRTTFDRLVRAQHFGTPTRLLDLTANPLFALYFACGKPSDCESKHNALVFELVFKPEQEKTFDSDTVSVLSNLARLNFLEKDNLREYLLKVWKSNSLPSGHFTSEDFIDRINERPELLRLVHFIRDEKPHFQNRILPKDLVDIFPVLPKRNNKRILAQSGAFLLFGLNGEVEHTEFGNSVDVKINRFQISRKAVCQIRKQLENISITENHLFPELDRAAQFVKEKYKTKKRI